MSSLASTLGNADWLRANEASIKSLLPDTWTLMDNVKPLHLAYQFKVLGIDWRSEDEFGKVMVFLEKVGIMQRQNGYQVRANPRSIFA